MKKYPYFTITIIIIAMIAKFIEEHKSEIISAILIALAILIAIILLYAIKYIIDKVELNNAINGMKNSNKSTLNNEKPMDEIDAIKKEISSNDKLKKYMWKDGDDLIKQWRIYKKIGQLPKKTRSNSHTPQIRGCGDSP